MLPSASKLPTTGAPCLIHWRAQQDKQELSWRQQHLKERSKGSSPRLHANPLHSLVGNRMSMQADACSNGQHKHAKSISPSSTPPKPPCKPSLKQIATCHLSGNSQQSAAGQSDMNTDRIDSTHQTPPVLPKESAAKSTHYHRAWTQALKSVVVHPYIHTCSPSKRK
jgi:hypothetical protein